MAQMLRDADSTPKHLSTARRHIRLCNALQGAEFLAQAIGPHYTRLVDALGVKKKAIDDEDDAQDDRDLHGREGADALRTTAERVKQYDRDTPGEQVFARIFPEGGYGDFIANNGTTSIESCRKIALRVRDLGPNHPLASLATDLESQATVIEDAQKVFEDAVRARKAAEAEDELAQAALRRAYEENWLDAQKKFGKAAAERLFPRLRRHAKADDDGES